MKILQTRNDLLKIIPKNLKIAELGVFKGDFSKLIKSICNPLELYLVDVFQGDIGSGDKDGNNFEFIKSF